MKDVPGRTTMRRLHDDVRGLRRHGEGLWERFHAGREQHLWYSRALVDAFRAAGAHGYLFDELVGEVTELECLAATA